jgi:hypothetical protein
MTMEQLLSDLEQNGKDLAKLGPNSSTAEVVAFLQMTLWPSVVALAEQTEEIDGCVADILEAHEDILQPETAQVFAGIIAGGMVLVAELKKRLKPEESKILQAVDEFEKLCAHGSEALAEITITESPEDAEVSQ